MPEIYVIGGPNGAGKTTSAKSLLPELLHCNEYINADAIAAALSPFNPESVSLQSGRLMLDRIHHLASQKTNFSFETTMASRSFAPFLVDCKKDNYKINLIFLWLEASDLALDRVKGRVASGGHDIPIDTILRRYKRSIDNFLNIYSPLADDWFLYNNSLTEPVIIAEKKVNKSLSVYDKKLGKNFRSHTMNKLNENDLFARIDFGIKRGVARALAEHKRLGQSISVWKDGHIVKISPEKIQIPEKYTQND